MTGGEWTLQALLVIGLFLVLPVAVKLERALTAFRRDRANLEQSAQQLTDAIKDAEVAIMRLRDVSRSAGQRIGEQVEHVEAAIRDIDVKTSDLQLMMDRAEALAGRLERSVRQKPIHDSGKGSEPAAGEEMAYVRPGQSQAGQPQPKPQPQAQAQAQPQPQPASTALPPRTPPASQPGSVSATAALAMQRALDKQTRGASDDTPQPRILAEQRLLQAIRGRTAKP